MDTSVFFALEAIREDPAALSDPFNFAVFVGYMQNHGMAAAHMLLDPNSLVL